MAERTTRSQDTRETAERRKGWKRQSLLPTPEPKDGYKYRWIRASTLGQEDNKNVSARFREGYVPVSAEEQKELKIIPDHNSRFSGNLEVGGLLLCKIAVEFSDERRDGQAEITAQQIDAVDRNLFRESDPRMPLLRPERETKVTRFGR